MKVLGLFSLVLVLLTTSCKNNKNNTNNNDTTTLDGHIAWIMQGNIYEVNTRQYTPEGTFNAFTKHLDRLKEMGVQTLWFMPINPISKKDRKRSEAELGSYYAVSNYTSINPEYGNMDDWKKLVNTAHEMGFKVIIDWVPTHSGADHYWLQKHPNFYIKDSAGNAISQYDWTDTRKLNYKNGELVDSMINCMKFWLTETNIDGFRCDVAGEVPNEFWSKCIPALKKVKPTIFMLAEGDKPSLHTAGFDATYTWEDFSMMKKIAKETRPAFALDSVINKHDTSFAKNALRLYFTSNHDENSWNLADFGTMPGNIHAPFAVITQTMKRSIPLIYSGQEEPFLDSLKFFVKDTITFYNYARANFYKNLQNLRSNNEALAANASFTKIASSNDKAIYAYARQAKNKKVVVITNLSSQPVQFTLNSDLINGKTTNLFTNKLENLDKKNSISLAAWGYLVYVY